MHTIDFPKMLINMETKMFASTDFLRPSPYPPSRTALLIPLTIIAGTRQRLSRDATDSVVVLLSHGMSALLYIDKPQHLRNT